MAIQVATGTECIRTSGTFPEPAIASVSLWAFFSTLPTNSRIIGTDTLWESRLVNTDMLHEFRQSAQPNMTTVFATSAWYHIVFVYDGTIKGAYVNGVADPAPLSLAHGANGNDTALSLGTSTWNATQGMGGRIEDVRIYNRVLSQQECETIFNSQGSDGIVNGLIHWWPLIGPVGQTVTNERDIVGNADLSTVVGSPIYVESDRSIFRGGY